VKVRGTAMTIYEKYQVLARDASASGDRIAAENYLQHAEHYYRLMQAAKAATQVQQPQQGPNPGQRDSRPDQTDGAGEAEAAPPRGGENREPRNDAQVIPPAEAPAPAVAAEAAPVEDEAPTPEPLRAPMSPAALAAEVAANEEGRGGNGMSRTAAPEDGNGEDVPRRAPRRRRRAAKADESGEQPEAPTEV